MKRKIYSIIGIVILAFLAISYFIKINIDSGANYIVKDSILGLVIFHNPFILAIYILVAVVLIVKEFNKTA